MIKIGLDTSCLNVKGKNNTLNQLEALEAQGKIILVTSTVNEKEQINTNTDEYWKDKYLKKINRKQKIFEVGRYGVSCYDQAVYADDQKCPQLEKIFSDKKDFYDLWLLQTACMGECDFFLTLNLKDFIDNGKKEELEKLGIKVRIPDDDFLKEINEKLATLSL